MFFTVTNQLQLQQLVDFETPSGVSDDLGSQLESTRVPDVVESLRLELSEITASTPSRSSNTTLPPSQPPQLLQRVPFASMIYELDTSEKSAIEN